MNKSLNLITFTNILEKISTLILIPVLANVLGKELFGFWTQAQVLIPIFLMILLFNLDALLVNDFSKKNIDEFKIHISKFFLMLKTNVLLFTLFLILHLLFPNFFSFLFFDKFGNFLLILAVLFYFFSEALLSTSITLCKVTGNHFITGLTLFLKLLIKLFCIAMIAIFELSMQSLLFSISALYFFLSAIFIKMILSEGNISFEIFKKSGDSLSTIKASMTFSIIGIGMFFAANTDRFVVLNIRGIEEVAMYSAAWSLGSLATITFFVFSPIIYPMFAAYKDVNDLEIKNIIQSFNSVFFIVFLPSIYIFFIYSDELFSLIQIKFLLNSNTQAALIAASVGAITYFNYLIYMPLVSMEKKIVMYSLLSITISKFILMPFFVIYNYELIGLGSILSILLGIFVLFRLSSFNSSELFNVSFTFKPIILIGCSYLFVLLISATTKISNIESLFIEVIFIGCLSFIVNKELRALIFYK